MTVIRSLSYPLTLQNGTLKTSTDYDVIRERIFQILETRPLERVMQSRYGTPDFVFNTYPTVAIVVERITIALETQIEGVEFGVSGTLNEDGTCQITIAWAIDAIPQPPIQYRLTA